MGEFLDNSIDAKSLNIAIQLNRSKVGKTDRITELVFSDDGDGMTSAELQDLFQFGASSKHMLNDKIGKFGVGFMTAILTLSTKVKVYSRKHNSDEFNTLGFDIEEVDLGYVIPTSEATEISQTLKEQIPSKIAERLGTIIHIPDIDQFRDQSADSVVAEAK